LKLPIYIDISRFNVLVLGGGYEATKKVSRILRHGPKGIIVYSLDFTDDLKGLSIDNSVSLVEGDVRDFDRVSSLIEWADLIIYTVPGLDDVERWMVDKCIEKRKLYIISTNASITQAALPVEMEVHGLRITAFSGGKSTLVALKVLDLIKGCLEGRNDIEYLLEAMYFLKLYMKNKGIPYKVRMRLYRELFRDRELLQYVDRGDLEGAKEYIKNYVDSRR